MFNISKGLCEVEIDYFQSFDEMKKDCDCESYGIEVSEKIFPISGMGKHKRKIDFFYFEHRMRAKKIIAIMAENGYRPARVEELLAVGKKYPDLQKFYPIAALGSVERLCWIIFFLRVTPILYWYNKNENENKIIKRYLRALWFDYNFDVGFRFAAVKI